jgi:hypothetical protein
MEPPRSISISLMDRTGLMRRQQSRPAGGQYFDHEVWEEALENYPKKLNLCSSNSFEIV